MQALDRLDYIFIGWAFFFQVILIIHFAIRKRFYETYTLKYGRLVYALSIPAAVISIILWLGGKSWSFWLGGFIFMIFATYGYRIDYIKQIQWRNPLDKSILFPYATLYLGTLMFYWWPLGILSKPLWFGFGALFVISTILNLRSH